MRVLGISSANKKLSIGFIDEDKVLVDKTADEMRSEKIIYYIKQKKIRPSQIDAVAVVSGPGSYSGLRGGMATAKLLSQTLNIPLVCVSTLEAIAFSQAGRTAEIVVILSAKRDEYNFARFKALRGKLTRLTDDQVAAKDKIDRSNAIVIEEVDPLGVDVARLGLLKLKAGSGDNPLSAVPNYSHQPNIRKFFPNA